MKLTHYAIISAAAGIVINKPYITSACMLCSSAIFFISFVHGVKKLRKDAKNGK